MRWLLPVADMTTSSLTVAQLLVRKAHWDSTMIQVYPHELVLFWLQYFQIAFMVLLQLAPRQLPVQSTQSASFPHLKRILLRRLVKIRGHRLLAPIPTDQAQMDPCSKSRSRFRTIFIEIAFCRVGLAAPSAR